MIIKVTTGNGTIDLPLELPATDAEFEKANSTLERICGCDRFRIVSVECPVSSLGKYIVGKYVSNPGVRKNLNTLAEKVNAMNALEAKTCAGALDSTSINSLDDVVRVASSLNEYIFIHSVTTEKELGRFLVDSGYKGFPESVRPYLDYNAIGIEYHAEHDGAFTADGYTIRRNSAEPLIAEREQSAVFRVHLQTGGMRNLGHDPFVLTLPVTDADIHYAKGALNIEDFEEAAIVKIESPEKLLLENVQQEDLDIALLNEIAETYAEAMKGLDAGKLRPALAMERPATLEEFCSEQGLEYPRETRKYVPRPASPSEAGLFYAQQPEQDTLLGGIGHLRMDFGSGDRFWPKWFNHGSGELNTPEFKAEFDEVVNELRQTVLKDRATMRSFCADFGGELGESWGVGHYGYVVETEHYRYCLRCKPREGDYDGYLWCFDKRVQEMNMGQKEIAEQPPAMGMGGLSQ